MNTNSKATGPELQENLRAIPRRAVIVYVLAAVLIAAFCLGVYFGMMVARIGGS